ncbi:hypothetical protein T265_09076 [Opisthorchis viverrini]|uniref:Cytochrome oxidase assembly protein n=1 Tax=Opisthorchis viverrini TaxID=6198 RepID=A0A074Z6X7_OPIVI|nr:hypothetical protein T265_09076 [Opisthorchis viverrini]KER22946.1 hypothetical protein T265_09076 [Opisthorchis viverrini]
MVDWHPFKEAPPLTEEQWLREFDKYKQFPEYQYQVNQHGEMSLSQFKFIWYMEYSHRMWGRLIGAVFAIPGAYFWYKGYFTRRMKPRVLIYGGLIGLQVKPFSTFKLAKILGHSTKALTFTTLIFGAFVAGLDAGLVYNTWPKMADRWVPDDLITPQYGSTFGNLLNNPTGVQFSHRILAYTTVACATALWATVMRTGLATTGPRIRTAAHLVLAAAVGQSTLGVVTLLYYVPVWLGVMHQGGSLVLLSSALWFTHCLRAVPK